MRTNKTKSINVYTKSDFDDSISNTSTTVDDYSDSYNNDHPTIDSYIHGNKVINEIITKSNQLHRKKVGQLTIKDLKFCKVLGEGQFGQVWLASIVNNDNDAKRKKPSCTVSKFDQEFVAVKIMSKFNLIHDIDNLINEISILREVSYIHPCLACMYDTIQDDNLIYIVQQFYAGGELFTLVNGDNDTKALVSRNCKFYSACIVDAIHFLHKRYIIFRDIKLENIMINHTNGYPVLIDFGYAKHFTDTNPRCYSMVGTPKYAAPEIINGGGYDVQADLWAIGILVYEMLVGYNPMEGDGGELDEMELFRCITEEDYIPVPVELSASQPDAVKLIDQLLQRDPTDRLHSSQELLCHDWFGDIDFSTIRQQQIQAPWVPNNALQVEMSTTTVVDHGGSNCTAKNSNNSSNPVMMKSMINTQYFDNWDYLANDPETCIFKAKYPKLTMKQQEKFHQLNI